MISKVISGGQTGVDRWALEEAKRADFATGGWAPKGYLTENGPDLTLRDDFGLREAPDRDYALRRRMNVAEADASVVLGHDLRSRGTLGLVRDATSCGKPYFLFNPVRDNPLVAAGELAALHRVNGCYLVVNVAGNRAGGAPAWFEHAAREWLAGLFRLILTGNTITRRINDGPAWWEASR